MHRTHLLTLLAEHVPTDDKEAADVAFIQRFVQTHSDCFGKANPLGHITGSAYIIDPAGRFLLTHHAKLKRWLQVGGHSDPHEHDPLQTALREAQEESGLSDLRLLRATPIDIDVHRIPERRKGERVEPAHDHLDIRYALLTQAPEQITLTAESLDLGWFALDELPGLGLDSAALRAAHKTHACWRASTCQ
jgi:8-oxo-dGTP pyrophosphatase MutT (NUDIX family)